MKKLFLVFFSVICISTIVFGFTPAPFETPKANATTLTLIMTLEKIEAWISIPESLKKDGNVDLGKFTEKIKGKVAYKDPKSGWSIGKDTAGHGGRKWKLFDKHGDRKASLDENGKVLSK